MLSIVYGCLNVGCMPGCYPGVTAFLPLALSSQEPLLGWPTCTQIVGVQNCKHSLKSGCRPELCCHRQFIPGTRFTVTAHRQGRSRQTQITQNALLLMHYTASAKRRKSQSALALASVIRMLPGKCRHNQQSTVCSLVYSSAFLACGHETMSAILHPCLVSVCSWLIWAAHGHIDVSCLLC